MTQTDLHDALKEVDDYLAGKDHRQLSSTLANAEISIQKVSVVITQVKESRAHWGIVDDGERALLTTSVDAAITALRELRVLVTDETAVTRAVQLCMSLRKLLDSSTTLWTFSERDRRVDDELKDICTLARNMLSQEHRK